MLYVSCFWVWLDFIGRSSSFWNINKEDAIEILKTLIMGNIKLKKSLDFGRHAQQSLAKNRSKFYCIIMIIKYLNNWRVRTDWQRSLLTSDKLVSNHIILYVLISMFDLTLYVWKIKIFISLQSHSSIISSAYSWSQLPLRALLSFYHQLNSK